MSCVAKFDHLTNKQRKLMRAAKAEAEAETDEKRTA